MYCNRKLSIIITINFLHYFVQANSKRRLRGGRDHIWMPLQLHSNATNVALYNGNLSKKVHHSLKGFTENLQKIKKLENHEHGLYQPVKADIKNIRKLKFQNELIPRNNAKLCCNMIQNNIDSSNILSARRSFNAKKVLDGSQKKFKSKFIKVLTEERNTLVKKNFKNISRVSILLLYLHFLLCYYLSFSKTRQFVEIFEMCPVKDNIN